jgi:hypothetical protein
MQGAINLASTLRPQEGDLPTYDIIGTVRGYAKGFGWVSPRQGLGNFSL